MRRWSCGKCGRIVGASRRHCTRCGASRGAPSSRTTVGTVLGHASLAELRDLLRAKSYAIKQLELAYAELAPDWVVKFPADAQAWLTDWLALQTRYTAAAANANEAIDAAAYNPLDDTLIPAQSEWDMVMRSIRQMWDGEKGNQVVRGDFADMNNRLIDAGGRPDYSQTPQPMIKSDADLRLFQAADVLVRQIEKPGGIAVGWWIAGGVAAGVLLARALR
ncbi:MAG: hypothetical protein ACHREM_21615 [Polyangiales bacterium]